MRRAAALLSVGLLLAAAGAAVARADDGELNRYYQLRQSDPAAARAALERAVASGPGDQRALLELGYLDLSAEHWQAALDAFTRALAVGPETPALHKQIAYLLVRLERPAEALAHFFRAEALGDRDPAAGMQAAYLQDGLGQKHAARERFAALERSDDPKVRKDACRALSNLRGYEAPALPQPLFAELDAEPFWQTQSSLGVGALTGRAGVVVERAHELEVYGSARYTQDDRSGVRDAGPIIYYDNVAVFAGGIRGKPVPQIPVSLFVEGGAAYDLIDRESTRWREDLRGGALVYWGWGLESACPGGLSFPFRPVVDVYGEMVYYSRYQDGIGVLRVRPGLRLVETDDWALDGYVKLFGGLDTQGETFNNLIEVGPGIVITHQRSGLRLRNEFTGRFFTDGTSDSTYRVQLEYFVRF
ncbi:MAG: tetratricopeptide repeat protein [Candidatus Eiseniibacteriota bacterium]